MPLKGVIAIDSMKGSLSSRQAGEAAAQGLRRVFPQGEVVVRPLADGGEGTVEALADSLNGRLETAAVTGPMGETVEAVYAIAGQTAVIEMAAAAGLPMVPPEERNPLRATTRGVGELIADAIAKGCRRFVVGIGGSATNDGGAGMLQALGFSLLDREGNPIAPGAEGLARLASVSGENALPQLKDCRFRVACDVNNPLCGERGASAVYGPQKGADEEMVRRMAGSLCPPCRGAGLPLPPGAAGRGGGRRPGLCLPDLPGGRAGVGHSDRPGGDPPGR